METPRNPRLKTRFITPKKMCNICESETGSNDFEETKQFLKIDLHRLISKIEDVKSQNELEVLLMQTFKEIEESVES
jgi:hypothetical protein